MSGIILSAEQRRAVERTGQDVCVVAGPGSGKTRVLTERFAWLVEQRGVDPARILAITFTEKAAIEIKQRVLDRFQDRADIREAVERAWVSTIHGFCMRLLKENAIAAGLAPDFVVLEQGTAEQMQRDSAEAVLDGMYGERPADLRRLLEGLDLSTRDDGRQDDLAASLVRIYEGMRVDGRAVSLPHLACGKDSLEREARGAARGMVGSPMEDWAEGFLRLPEGAPTLAHLEALAGFKVNLNKVRHPEVKRFKQEIKDALEAQWLGAWYADLHELLNEGLSRLDVEYRKRKRGESAVDFSDLEEFAVKLLESSEAVRVETVGRFDEVLMDELQDTNRVQWRLVELVKSRLYAVGDINQSIYGFRHADPEVFAEYRDSVRAQGGEIDELRGNYRSRPQILDCVSRMLDGQVGIEARELEAKGAFAEVDGPVVERFCGMGDDAADVEAAMVAARIGGGEFAYRDVAVLVRTLAAAEPFEEAFERAGIPFLVSGGRGFLESRETLDVMNLLAALVNVLDEIPLVGVLRGPLVGMADEEIFRVGREGWRRVFEERFGRLRALAGLVAPDRLLAQALDECGYWGSLTERARANVDKLLGWVRREFRNRPRPLAELLEDLEALRDAQSVADAAPPEAGNVVRVMTIHAAKGLEFPVVFVAALQKGPDRRTPGLLYSRELGLGAKWRNPVTGEGASDSVHEQLKARESAREKEEANRLLYVAMTRAEQRLILSHAERKNKSPWEKLAMAVLPNAEWMAEAPVVAGSEAAGLGVDEVLIEAPKVAGQYDSAASVTSVALFEACPRKYYLARYLGLEPDGGGTGAIATGLAVHAVLAGQQIENEEANVLAGIFQASEWGQRVARATRVEREFDFLFETEDVILRGQVDLWFEEAGELILVDYKTDREQSSAGDYALQLRLYALAVLRYAGRLPDRALLYYVRPDEAVDVSLGEAELEAAQKSVRRFREAQERGEFAVLPGEQCKKCSFWGGMCPEGRG
ncbi:MAG: UvrD-helicase domain-containing protein [Acidobacteriota bacterium]